MKKDPLLDPQVLIEDLLPERAVTAEVLLTTEAKSIMITEVTRGTKQAIEVLNHQEEISMMTEEVADLDPLPLILIIQEKLEALKVIIREKISPTRGMIEKDHQEDLGQGQGLNLQDHQEEARAWTEKNLEDITNMKDMTEIEMKEAIERGPTMKDLLLIDHMKGEMTEEVIEGADLLLKIEVDIEEDSEVVIEEVLEVEVIEEAALEEAEEVVSESVVVWTLKKE